MSTGQNERHRKVYRKVYTPRPRSLPFSISTGSPSSSPEPLPVPSPSHRSLFFLARSRRVHAPPRTRAHSSTWLAGFTCARKRREPTPGVPAARCGTATAPASRRCLFRRVARVGGRLRWQAEEEGDYRHRRVVGQRWYVRMRERE